MSQHFCNRSCNGQPVEVQMGWDRPLQGFYLLVEKDIDLHDEPDYLYSTINDDSLRLSLGTSKEISYLIEVLKGLGIAVPEKMIERVIKDRQNNAVNRIEVYS